MIDSVGKNLSKLQINLLTSSFSTSFIFLYNPQVHVITSSSCLYLLFQSLFCLLNNTTSNSIEKNCLISSLTAGASYLFYPRYIVITTTISNAIESLYKIVSKSFEDKGKEPPKIMKIIDRVPVLLIMLTFATSMLVQLRVFYPSLMNRIVAKTLTIGTNGRADALMKNLMDLLMGFK
jgi:hypothetical protein